MRSTNERIVAKLSRLFHGDSNQETVPEKPVINHRSIPAFISRYPPRKTCNKELTIETVAEEQSVLGRYLAAALLSSIGLHAAFASRMRGVPHIVDADTIYIGETKVRFSGVDAPETDQTCLDAAGKAWSCGIEAREQLRTFSRDREWSCDLTGNDIYGRSLGTCAVGGVSISQWLVLNGWALAFRRYSLKYVADEDIAREHQRGLWKGAFIAPWELRHRSNSTIILGSLSTPTQAQRALVSGTATNSPPATGNCLIKGNLSSTPQCIYHVPGGQFYDRLKMQPSSSRRWFCTEAEAQAAGCRKSKL